MEKILKSEVREIACPDAKLIRTIWHNANNLNNCSTLFTHKGKSLAKLNRKAKQKANKELGKQVAMQMDKQGFYLGRLFYAHLATDAIPYNTKKGTEYLLPKGTEVLIEVCKSGFRAYNLGGLTYYSLTAVKSSLRSFRLIRNEFHMSNKAVKFTQIGKGATNAVGFYEIQGHKPKPSPIHGFRVPLV